MSAPTNTVKHTPNRVQGMVRSMDQWRNMVPAAVSVGSQAQVEYALHDAKTDIEALWTKVEQLGEALQMVADSGKFTCFDDAAWDTVNDAISKATGSPAPQEKGR